MKEEGNTSVVGYIATVDIDELTALCIGFLGESQSMSPEDRTIASNLLGDAASIAESSTNDPERVRLLRITEAAIGGVALGDNSTIAALFHRHKTELDRRRRKAMTQIIVESPSNDEPAVPPEQPRTPPPETAAEVPQIQATPSDSAIQASAVVAPPSDEEPQVRRRQRDSSGRFSKKRSNNQ